MLSLTFCSISWASLSVCATSWGCKDSGDLTVRLRLLQQLPRFANLREWGGTRERLKEARRGGVELSQAACKLLLFDHYIIASHAAPAVHSWSHSCACASSCRWRVSNQYVAYQPVTVHPAGGDLVPGHLCYELCPQACQPGGSGGAPHCQLPRYAPLTSLLKREHAEADLWIHYVAQVARKYWGRHADYSHMCMCHTLVYCLSKQKALQKVSFYTHLP